MDWSGARIVERDLTVLVTDIRNSTRFLSRCQPAEARAFLREMSSLTAEILEDISGGNRDECHINGFVGDGFLIFFDEADLDVPERTGPVRALIAARRMRAEFRRMCRTRFGQFSTTARAALRQLGLVSGISHGEVLYGDFTTPATDQRTGMRTTVVKSFRFSKVRDDQVTSHRDCILICDESVRQVGKVNAAAKLTGTHAALVAELGAVKFPRLRLPPLGGLGRVKCHEAVWPNWPPQPPSTRLRARD